jgi:hypothetical protein
MTLSTVHETCVDERGVSFMAVMILTLMTGVLGVAALTMTGMENSMAGAVRMVEEGTHAAESCIGSAVRVINMVQEDPSMAATAAVLVAPQGPVPAMNAAFLSQEINGNTRNHRDVAFPSGDPNYNPNLSMTVNNYTITGDIDFLYSKQRAGEELTEGIAASQFYRADCTAVNTATGTTSHVIATFECLQKSGEGCQKRTGV